MEILNGRKYRKELLEKYKEKIEKEKLSIELHIIFIGDDLASELYVGNKVKYSTQVGIKVEVHRLLETVTEKEVIDLIEKLNKDEKVTGIILQSPIPKHINFYKCVSMINSSKDVDGITKDNIFALYQNKERVLPCTVNGIIMLLEHYDIDFEGKNVVIIGRSEIVGKPLALALTNRNATVTLCHSKTQDLRLKTKEADILISAVGKAKFVTKNMVKAGFIGVDVGINDNNGQLCGDFDYDNIKDYASFITPVPGGIGPMTISMIIDNLIELKRTEEENGQNAKKRIIKRNAKTTK